MRLWKCDLSKQSLINALGIIFKGGVIMDVTNAEQVREAHCSCVKHKLIRQQRKQARIAEEAGACAVMALERVPADIRRDGGVSRMVRLKHSFQRPVN